ncbi:MAG: hypothetical protein IT426_20635 [Pirellulales bacterium]|nr:hypothetical protein [Pirellulales bacterium]
MNIIRTILTFAVLLSAGYAAAESSDASQRQRPEWLRREGIVMAGSWEPLMFRARRDGKNYDPTPEQLAGWRREHSPEMIARLKSLGVNFVMMHSYKGAGLKTEQQSMQEAVQFSRLCHEAGLRVGVYACSGAFLWEHFFREVPEAKNWLLLDASGQPVRYGGRAYRYYWDRNHPDAEAFYQELVKFAVNDVRTDMVHLDNYVQGPGYDRNSTARFRGYLRDRFTAEQLARMGVNDVNAARPPKAKSPDLLKNAWNDFCCESLAESYHRMGDYARSQRPEMLVVCNPRGVFQDIRPPIDHGRLLPSGDGYFNELFKESPENVYHRIRSYKAGRALGNMTFCYTRTPWELAESMAFNLDALGCVCWFEYGEIVAMPAAKESMSPLLEPYIRFFHRRRDLLGGAEVVADVAVLRSFPSQVFGGKQNSALTARAEELLIDDRIPFQIIFDHQLNDLKCFKTLVLAGCEAMGDKEVEAIRRFVAAGGRLCAIGPLATHDEWMRPRAKPALDDLPSNALIRIAEKDDWLSEIRRAAGGDFAMSIPAQSKDLRAELTEQPRRRMVHLVNYRTDAPARQVAVALRLPAGCRAKSAVLAGPDHPADLPLTMTQDGDVVHVAVPEVKVYEIVVVNYSTD